MITHQLYSQDKQNILAEEYAGTKEASTQTDQNTGRLDAVGPSLWDYVSMIFGLGIVVAIIVAIFFLIKKGLNKKIVENELIKILGSKVISGNKTLHLIEVGNLIYLVGSANENISLIAEVSEKETKDTLKLKASQAQMNPIKGFGDLISGFIHRRGQKKEIIDQSVDFMKEQRSRLHKLNQK